MSKVKSRHTFRAQMLAAGAENMWTQTLERAGLLVQPLHGLLEEAGHDDSKGGEHPSVRTALGRDDGQRLSLA